MNSPAWLAGKNVPVPYKEKERLEALSRYEDLESEPVQDEAFDRLASLAAHICNVPIAFINLLGNEKEFKKACFGFKGETTPRNISFCQFTILQDEIFEVEDATKHKLFKNNPNVTGSLKLTYYAGIPVQTPDGYNIGTLCLIDHKPGKLTNTQREALKTISDEIISRFELLAAREKLEQLNAEKDELIRIVSHDLRNPLAGIIGFSELLREETENDEHRFILDQIENAGESILNIVNVLLKSDYIRNEAYLINRKQADIVSVTEQVLAMHKPFISLKKQGLSVEMPESLQCIADVEKWKQIVGNLLSNAIKFTPVNGSVSLKLRLLELRKNQVELTITDSGIGIPEEMIKNLFSGKESTQRKGTEGEESTGLGMFIIKKYVSLLNGTIKVESKQGEGTEFTVQIPV